MTPSVLASGLGTRRIRCRPTRPLGGVFRGPDRVLEFGRLLQFYSELHVEPDMYHEAGDSVLVQGHHRGRAKDGPSLEVPLAHVWTLRDGKAVSLREYTDTAVLARVVGLSWATSETDSPVTATAAR